MRGPIVVLLLALPLFAAVAHAAPGADELALTRSLARATQRVALGHPACRAFCESTPAPESHTQDCWGLFKMWCGPPPAKPGEKPQQEISGYACQGHFKSVLIPTPDGGHALVTMCEGGQRWFSSKTSTCPHSGHTHKKIMGVLAAGETINIMRVSGPEAQTLAAQAATGQQSAQSTEEGLRWYHEVVGELQRLNVPGGSGIGALGDDGSSVFSLESKHHGFKSEWQATKRIPPSSAPAAEETFESVEEEVTELLAPSWRDWLPAPPPPARHGNGTFELLCNGKPAWLHGAVPCWGNFTVAGTNTWSPSSSSSSPVTLGSSQAAGDDAKKPCHGKSMGGAGSMMGAHSKHEPLSLRRLLATPLHLAEGQEQVKAMEQPHHAAATTAAVAVQTGKEGGARVGEVVSHTVSMKAECDGLWSGLLGHTCMGVSVSHLEITVEEDEAAAEEDKEKKAVALAASEDEEEEDDDDEPALDKWSICSGHQSIRFVHREYTVGMVVTCKGAAVLSMNVTLPPQP